MLAHIERGDALRGMIRHWRSHYNRVYLSVEKGVKIAIVAGLNRISHRLAAPCIQIIERGDGRAPDCLTGAHQALPAAQANHPKPHVFHLRNLSSLTPLSGR